MRASILVLVTAAFLTSCATRPNRTEPKWTVAPAERAKTYLRMAEGEVDANGVECEQPEALRAKNFKNVVERELWEAGFEIAKEEPTPSKPLDVVVRVALKDCREGLFGDVGLALKANETTVVDVAESEIYFSNLRTGANLLVDGVVKSQAVADFASGKLEIPTATVSTATVATSTTTH